MTQTSTPANASPAPLVVLLLVLIGGGAGLSFVAGAGPAALLGGYTAAFLGIAGFLGTLRSDLRLLSWAGPLMMFAISAPRLIAPAVPWVAIVLVAGLVFLAVMLPARGAHRGALSVGLALGTLIAFAYPITSDSRPIQAVIATICGLVVAVVLRVAFGVRDPSAPVRQAAARLLTADAPAFAATFGAWLADRPSKWLGEVLIAVSAFRLVRAAQRSGDPAATSVDDLDARAAAVAALIRARQRPAHPVSVQSTDDPAVMALDRAERAAVERDMGVVPLGRRARRTLVAATLLSPLSWHSRTIWHAVRASVGVFAALVVAQLTLEPGDPLRSVLISTTYSLIQVSWYGTLRTARNRVLGVGAGAVVLAAAIWILPPQVLSILGAAGLIVGLWFVMSKPVIANAGWVVVSVGLGASSRGLDPGQSLLEYLTLLVVALAIGISIGFVSIPGTRPLPTATLTAAAMAGLREHLVNLSGDAVPSERTIAAAIQSLRHVDVAAANLRSAALAHSDAQPERTQRSLALATSIQVLAQAAFFAAAQEEHSATQIDRALEILSGAPEGGDTSGLPVEPGDSWTGLISDWLPIGAHVVREGLRGIS